MVRIDTLVPALSADTVDVATRAERLGFDGVWSMENSNDGFLPHALVAEHTDDIQMGTRIALSFTRSPMVLAQLAWDLAKYSNGRFVLGLGTQVKAHNERRFSLEWESPGPRLREVVESIRHIWEVFQGEREHLDYQGEFYSFSLMTPRFNPGPVDHPDVPLYLAGVNEYNLTLAGELGDGLAVHPFTSTAYLEQVIHPHLADGASRRSRSPDDVDVLHSPLVITGTTDEELDEQRERVRRRVAFYASTPTYHSVLEPHGWGDIGTELHSLSREQKWDEMAALVSDEMLRAFSVEAPAGEIVDTVRSRYDGAVDRVVLPPEHAEHYDLG